MDYQSRFTQVIYDKDCGEKQWILRQRFLELERRVMERSANEGDFDNMTHWAEKFFTGGRCNALGHVDIFNAKVEYMHSRLDEVLIGLESAYYWYGKAIRDEQILKNSGG